MRQYSVDNQILIFMQNPKTKQPVYENGEMKLETFLVRYKWVTVFDVSQTAGEPLFVTRDFVNERFLTDADGKELIYEYEKLFEPV